MLDAKKIVMKTVRKKNTVYIKLKWVKRHSFDFNKNFVVGWLWNFLRFIQLFWNKKWFKVNRKNDFGLESIFYYFLMFQTLRIHLNIYCVYHTF